MAAVEQTFNLRDQTVRHVGRIEMARFRGQVLELVDFAQRLGIEYQEPTAAVVAWASGGRRAFAVEELFGQLVVDQLDLPALATGDFSSGVVLHEDEVIPIIEPGAIAGAWSVGDTSRLGFSDLQQSALRGAARRRRSKSRLTRLARRRRPKQIGLASMLFEATDLTSEELGLQREVRAFLEAELPRGTFRPGLGMGAARDREFSAKLARHGWLGMSLPARYGGHDRSAVDRFVVTEELLRWGAPVGHHWVADRQTGPVINRFGSEEQKERFLPPICRGELSFAIGMSEPEAGSDLASVRTRARRVDGGWTVSGTKVWTSGAHASDWFIVLCRTGDEEDRHRGLSQLIVDLRSDGLTVSPIPFLNGTSDFNEVVLDEVFVPDELVLGEVGQGWAQNTSELAYERGGPERWLSIYLVVEELLRDPDVELGERGTRLLGAAVARWWAIRRMSLSVARMIDEGEAPAVQSALVKELGTRFEQDLLEAVLRVLQCELSPESERPLERLLVEAVLTAPSFTIRGGTNEILRSVAAKGLAAL